MLELRPERLHLLDGNAQPVSICGKAFLADASGALFWPGERMLIVSDLHLEKGSAMAERGQFLPPYDTRNTLMRLAQAIDRYEPDCVLALGDSLHDAGAGARITSEDREILAMIQEDRTWIWVTGNHDAAFPDGLGGTVRESCEIAGIKLRHLPRSGRTTHEICGHLHPAAKVSLYGHTVRRPCFIGNGRRLVLPAFGAYTGGLNVLDTAFEPLFGNDGFNVWMLGQEGLYPVATRLLRTD